MTRTNRTHIVSTVLCGLVVVLLTSPLFAQTPTQRAVGKPTAFKVTVTKVEAYNGTSFVSLFTGSAQLDLVTAGGAASFPGIANLTIPAGTYSQIRITFANQFGIQGSLPYLGVTWYTTSTTTELGAVSNGSSDAASAGEAALLNPAWGVLGAPVTQTIAISPITVTAATDYQPTLKFDVSTSLALWEVGGVLTTASTFVSHYFTLAPITVTLL